jgi:hypothetical protein
MISSMEYLKQLFKGNKGKFIPLIRKLYRKIEAILKMCRITF